MFNERETRALDTLYHVYLHSLGPRIRIGYRESEKFVEDMAAETIARQTLSDFAKAIGVQSEHLRPEIVLLGSCYSNQVRSFRTVLRVAGLTDAQQVELWRDVLLGELARHEERVVRAVMNGLHGQGVTVRYQQVLERLCLSTYDQGGLDEMLEWAQELIRNQTSSK